MSSVTLAVQETFQETIQGEGRWFGAIVDFIRLYGCPVGCFWCDQDYAEGGKHLPYTHREIRDLVSELKSPRCVISGGEPFTHKYLPELCRAILDSGKQVSIETSGAFWKNIRLS